MKTIPLTRGKFAIVDDEDHAFLSGFKWCVASGGRTFYAVRSPDGRHKIYMHRQILSAPSTRAVDHINHNGLDNRRGNLRLATTSQNGQNSPKTGGRTSQFKGVTRATRPVGWKSSIRVSGKLIHLGYFSDERDAARAYDLAASKYFGEFASINFA